MVSLGTEPEIERDFAPPPDEEGQQYPTDEWSLCLSGGGFRAMLFHAGALWRLHQTRMLPRIAFFSSVSGGSIANGWLALKWAQLSLPSANFEDVFVEGMRAMARCRVDIPAVVRGLLWGGVARRVAAAYDRTLFGGARLQSLPDAPRFIFTSANLQSGALWRFSKPYMGDYKVGRILAPDLPLSTAVAASSAFPPILTPLVLRNPINNYTPIARPPDMADKRYRARVVLTDGGVYDNLGLEPIIKRTRTILVSDGGMPFATKPRLSHLWSCQILRVLDCEDNQVRSLRKRDLIDRYQIRSDLIQDGVNLSSRLGYRRLARAGTYWGIRTGVADYPTTPGLPCPPNLTERLASISTRLWRVPEADQERLINWGYAVCDYAIRAHVDPTIKPAPAWPYPRGLG
jgi:NTE family protein